MLQVASEKGAHIVVIAEALENQEKKTQPGAFNLEWDSQYLAIYVRKDRLIKIVGKDCS